VQTSEKVSLSYRLEVKNRGGHSSLPPKDNAIYHLAGGIARLAQYDFPVKLNETTRAFIERSADLEEAPMAADMRAVISPQPDPVAVARLSNTPAYNAQLRSTCVATMLEGGHAYNALPQVARAIVNCRILPGEPAEEVRNTLVRVLADDQICVTPIGTPNLSPPSPLNPEVMQAIERLTAEFWPGVPVIPTMSTGATDGAFLRNTGIPTFGHSGLGADIVDVRTHGKDERILTKSFYDGQQYLYRLVKTLSSGQ
jgi:acetylornithine deacetylase/succinyl-diaminopimelate desuccinylase-like protein